MTRSGIGLTIAAALSLAAPAVGQGWQQNQGQQQQGQQQTWQGQQGQQGQMGTQQNLQNQELVWSVEHALRQQGYEPGSIDGVFTQRTQQALTNFQQAQGIYPSGQIDQQTLRQLEVAAQTMRDPQVQMRQQQQAAQQRQMFEQQKHAQAQSVGQQRLWSVEHALNQLGYDPGDVDGRFTDRTQQALTNFQQAQGLQPSGELDQQTMRQIDVAAQRQAEQQGFAQQQGATQQGATQQAAMSQRGDTWASGESWVSGESGAFDASAQGTPQPAITWQVEQELVQRGFRPGNIDGEFTEQTSQALLNFQQTQGLQPTGEIDQPTLAALDVSRGYGGGGAAEAGPFSAEGAAGAGSSGVGAGGEVGIGPAYTGAEGYVGPVGVGGGADVGASGYELGGEGQASTRRVGAGLTFDAPQFEEQKLGAGINPPWMGAPGAGIGGSIPGVGQGGIGTGEMYGDEEGEQQQ